MNKILAVFCALGITVACSGKKAVSGGTCKATAECSAGLFCVTGKCTDQQCQANTDCGSGQICTASFACVTASAPGGGTLTPIAITDIHGDTANGSGPEGYFTTGGVVITGTGFDASTTVQIAAKAASQVWTSLTSVSVAGASTITAQLPTSLTPSTYSVRVSSTTTGSAARDVTLLQGPQGVKLPTTTFHNPRIGIVRCTSMPATKWTAWRPGMSIEECRRAQSRSGAIWVGRSTGLHARSGGSPFLRQHELRPRRHLRSSRSERASRLRRADGSRTIDASCEL